MQPSILSCQESQVLDCLAGIKAGRVHLWHVACNNHYLVNTEVTLHSSDMSLSQAMDNYYKRLIILRTYFVVILVIVCS